MREGGTEERKGSEGQKRGRGVREGGTEERKGSEGGRGRREEGE